MLTRKHFIELADILREESEHLTSEASRSEALAHPYYPSLERLTSRIADFCHSENPNFSRSRFLTAATPLHPVPQV